MSKPDDVTKEERADWLVHPYTQAWSKFHRTQTARMLQELLARCSETTDPKVAKAHSDYVNQATSMGFFSGQTDGR